MSEVLNQYQGENFILYNGDCIEIIKGIPGNSIHYSIFSPPFPELYTYSDSVRDLGNCKDINEFLENFTFLVTELYRVMMPGRLVSIHCMDIPAMKEKDGYIGLKDFPAMIRQLFEEAGFIYHSKVTIWKDPLTEATRTHALGLLHKQVIKDSSMCRQGLPDYLLTMRKPGENPEPINHPEGFKEFYGEDEPAAPKGERPKPDMEAFEKHQAYTGGPLYSHQVWRRYASPVWMDINQSNTLNARIADDSKDEKHICPLQLDVIDRGIQLWSNPGDTILSPFAGIGSEIYETLKMDRRGIGIELKESYFNQAVKNCKAMEQQKKQGTLFDLVKEGEG